MRSLIDKRKLTATAMAAAMAVFLLLPAPASAKENLGAGVVVTKLDGGRIEGELLAVRKGSLLILGLGRSDESVDLADVQSVRIVKKFQAGAIFMGGLVAGATAGACIGIKSRHEDLHYSPYMTGAILGAVGALAGLVVGASLGVDTKFELAGEPEKVVMGRLAELARLSRESRNLRRRS
jgi:hypothetical protein